MNNGLSIIFLLAIFPAVVMAESYRNIIVPEFGPADILQLATVDELPERKALTRHIMT